MMLATLLSVALAAPMGSHEDANPLYRQLLDPGLAIGADLRAKLPPPSMADGLDAAAQRKVIQDLIGSDYSYEEFTRKSVVAPLLLKIRDVKPSDPAAPARGVDVWCVGYGDLAAADDAKFRERLLSAGREGGKESKGGSLTREELAKRGIMLPADDTHESYGHFGFDFLDRVRLRASGRAVWSRTPDSLLIAAEIDPRFVGDKEFPNQWQPLTRDGGEMKAGPAAPWGGAGFYLKITKLHEPAGALFIEQHVVFAEPTGWFDGANLLRSKLPPAVQTIVRNMRREWVKGKSP